MRKELLVVCDAGELDEMMEARYPEEDTDPEVESKVCRAFKEMALLEAKGIFDRERDDVEYIVLWSTDVRLENPLLVALTDHSELENLGEDFCACWRFSAEGKIAVT